MFRTQCDQQNLRGCEWLGHLVKKVLVGLNICQEYQKEIKNESTRKTYFFPRTKLVFKTALLPEGAQPLLRKATRLSTALSSTKTSWLGVKCSSI
jgi:hypothetical protein